MSKSKVTKPIKIVEGAINNIMEEEQPFAYRHSKANSLLTRIFR